MGVRGLQTYMQKNNETFEINLKTEIAKWKKYINVNIVKKKYK